MWLLMTEQVIFHILSKNTELTSGTSRQYVISRPRHLQGMVRNHWDVGLNCGFPDVNHITYHDIFLKII